VRFKRNDLRFVHIGRVVLQCRAGPHRTAPRRIRCELPLVRSAVNVMGRSSTFANKLTFARTTDKCSVALQA